MNKDNKLFEIQEYIVCENDIDVVTEKRDYFISLKKFEQWLEDSGRLSWEENYSDHTGEHVQETGIITLDTYWKSSMIQIQEDIYDFIVLTKIGEKAFDLQPVLARVLNNAYSPLNKAI